MTRRDQFARFGQLVLGGLTASRDELAEVLSGDPEAVETVRERGAEIARDVGSRIKRAASPEATEGRGAKRMLNSGCKITVARLDDPDDREPRR